MGGGNRNNDMNSNQEMIAMMQGMNERNDKSTNKQMYVMGSMPIGASAIQAYVTMKGNEQSAKATNDSMTIQAQTINDINGINNNMAAAMLAL
jgi:hypothetical protein